METEEETDMAGAIGGIITLIVGWYLIYDLLDLVFIKKSEFVSQSFFLLNLMLALIIVMTGIWLVARYTRHLDARDADGREEVLKAERDRLKNDLVKAGICLLGMSLIVVPLSLIYPSRFGLWLSAFAILMVVGIISFWVTLLMTEGRSAQADLDMEE